VPAPPVLEFDVDGNLLRSWGGPGEGYEWVGREHGIEVDERGFVWIGGNADNDNAILKFTLDGKFVSQIGKIAPSKGSSDTTQLGKPAETAIDKAADEIYVADGYGNHRVIVFDATTGAYKRHWGAYGNVPNDDKQAAYDPKASVSQQFGNPVHCVKIADDGLVYVCDRINDRIQVFKKDGTFVKEWFYEKSTLGNGAVWDLALWPDPKQTYLLSADEQRNPNPQARGWQRGRQLWPQRPQRRAVSLGAYHGGRQARQRLYRRGRQRQTHSEIQADLGRATLRRFLNSSLEPDGDSTGLNPRC
jgi:hypothetical protein